MSNGRLIADLMNTVERAMAKMPCVDRQGPTVAVRTDVPMPEMTVPAALMYEWNFFEGSNLVSAAPQMGRSIEVM